MIDQAGEVFVKEGTAFFPGSSLAGNGLLVSDGDVWRRQRRLSNPSFRRAAVEAYADAMVAATQRLLDTQWQPAVGQSVLWACERVWGRGVLSTRRQCARSMRLSTAHAPIAGQTRDVYVDFNQLTLQVTLDALFGCSLGGADSAVAAAEAGADGGGGTALQAADAQGSAADDAWTSPSSSSSSSPEAERIVTAIAKAFHFFTRRAGAAMLLPEWLPTWDNLEFASAVAQLDKVRAGGGVAVGGGLEQRPRRLWSARLSGAHLPTA